jgi:hypothetical protein
VPPWQRNHNPVIGIPNTHAAVPLHHP